MPRSVRFAVTTLLVVSCIQLAFSRTALCAEPLDPERLLKEALSQEALDPRQILTALLGEAGTFRSNGTDGGDISVELLGFDKDGNEVRLIGDVGASGFRSFVECQSALSMILRHDRDVIWAEKKQWTQREDRAVQIDWEALSSRGSVATETSRMDVSISGMLPNVTDWTSVEFNARLSELRAIHRDGETLIVRLRTPDDSEQHGSLISHASVWREGHRVRELRCPARGESDLRMPRWSRPQFDVLMQKQSLILGQSPSLPENMHLKGMRFCDWYQHGDKVGPVVEHENGSELERLFSFSDATRYKNGSPSELPSNASEFTELRLLDGSDLLPVYVGFCILQRHNNGSTRSCPLINCDSAVDWRRIESFSSFTFLKLFVSNLVDVLAVGQKVTPEVRVRNASLCGTIGRPIGLSHRVKECPNRELLEALLWSHWEFPCSTSHVQACLDVLQKPMGSVAYPEAIECLVLLDHLDRVSSEKVSAWWAGNVLRVGSGLPPEFNYDGENHNELSKPSARTTFIDFRRWRTIWFLSRFPTGRQVLRDRLETNDPLVVRQLALRALHLRAESAIRNQRYDFMSRSECEACLAIPEIGVGGRDLSGGKARPFPTDDTVVEPMTE